MEYSSKEYNDILSQFKKGAAWLNDVSINIIGDTNELDPLVLLRAYEETPTVDSSLALASQMVLNRVIEFKQSGKVIHTFTYNGGNLSDKFVKAPYLLDPLLKLCYGIMVKKLTPPSDVLDPEGPQSENNR